MNGENWEKVILNKCELPRLFTNTIGPLVKTHFKFQSTSLVFASLHKIINFLLSIRITKASRLNKFCCFISLFRRSFTHRHSFKICNDLSVSVICNTKTASVLCACRLKWFTWTTSKQIRFHCCMFYILLFAKDVWLQCLCFLDLLRYLLLMVSIVFT